MVSLMQLRTRGGCERAGSAKRPAARAVSAVVVCLCMLSSMDAIEAANLQKQVTLAQCQQHTADYQTMPGPHRAVRHTFLI